MKQYSRTSKENGWGRTQEKKKKPKGSDHEGPCPVG